MSQLIANDVNPESNFQARVATLDYVQVKLKTREVDGEFITQVGLFARPDLSEPIRKAFVLLEETPLSFTREEDHATASHDDDEDISPIRQSLGSLNREKKAIFDLLYNSPEFEKTDTAEEAELARWWTNRFMFRLKGRDGTRSVIVEIIYQHCSAIDHSCFNANARAVLKKGDPGLAVQIVAQRDICNGEEILIHYDWEMFHDRRSGRRRKSGEEVHSDLWMNRGFHCDNCVFQGSSCRRPRQRTPPTDLRRQILKAVSPLAVFKRQLEKEKAEIQTQGINEDVMELE